MTVVAYPPVEPSIFGRIITGWQVEQWCIDVLKRWESTYLSEVERQSGMVAGTLQRARSFVRTISFDKWPEDQLPAVMLVSTGLAEPPKKLGDGAYRKRWLVGVGVCDEASTQEAARRNMHMRATAMQALLVQRPSLDGQANGVVLLDDSYDNVPYDDGRTLSGGISLFAVDVENCLSANAGPLLPDVPADEPWQDWPVVTTHDELVERVDQIPNGGDT